MSFMLIYRSTILYSQHKEHEINRPISHHIFCLLPEYGHSLSSGRSGLIIPVPDTTLRDV